VGFNMSHNAKQYYDKLRDGEIIKIQFDFYYICLLIGFKFKEFGKNVELVEFFHKFPNEYLSRKEEIIGTLITTEIKRLGVNVENKSRVQELMLKLVNPESITRLSSEGEKLMNKYAEGGFNFIVEKIGSCSTTDTFLVRYYDEFMAETTGSLE